MTYFPAYGGLSRPPKAGAKWFAGVLSFCTAATAVHGYEMSTKEAHWALTVTRQNG